MHRLRLTVNSQPVELEAAAHTLLVDLLRGPLALTGTHVGCDTAQCGACTVLLDGDRALSCLALAVAHDGAEITTADGLAADGELHPVQQAFHDNHALQCGYCTPGMIMQSIDLLGDNPDPTEHEVREGIEADDLDDARLTVDNYAARQDVNAG